MMESGIKIVFGIFVGLGLYWWAFDDMGATEYVPREEVVDVVYCAEDSACEELSGKTGRASSYAGVIILDAIDYTYTIQPSCQCWIRSAR